MINRVVVGANRTLFGIPLWGWLLAMGTLFLTAVAIWGLYNDSQAQQSIANINQQLNDEVKDSDVLKKTLRDLAGTTTKPLRGEPPTSWLYTAADGTKIACIRDIPFDPAHPTYHCAAL